MTVFREDDQSGLISSALLFVQKTAPLAGSPDPTQQASYSFAIFPSVVLNGTGFTYDPSGLLNGGTITSIAAIGRSVSVPAGGTADMSREEYSAFALPVQQAYVLAQANTLQQTLLAGNDTIAANSPQVNGYGGDDVITLYGMGHLGNTATLVDGGGGANTVAFAGALRAQAQVFQGGGNETVRLPTLFAGLTSAQTLQFIDGSLYESNADPGAQAALMFKGIFGRLPDAINAGGYALVADQQGTVQAASQMLATPEAQASTGQLNTADYIARLYQGILGRMPDAAASSSLSAGLDSGAISRAWVAAQIASSPEAQQVNAITFDLKAVFGANPYGVDTLRAYEVLLNRLPEASSLANDSAVLATGASLQQLYASIQASPEFNGPSQPPNPFGITATTAYQQVYAVTHSDAVTAMISPLVTNQGIAVHA